MDLVYQIKQAKNTKELNEHLLAFIREMKDEQKVKIDDLSSNPKKQQVIVELIKRYIDQKIFKEENFTVFFKDKHYAEIKKLTTTGPRTDQGDNG